MGCCVVFNVLSVWTSSSHPPQQRGAGSAFFHCGGSAFFHCGGSASILRIVCSLAAGSRRSLAAVIPWFYVRVNTSFRCFCLLGVRRHSIHERHRRRAHYDLPYADREGGHPRRHRERRGWVEQTENPPRRLCSSQINASRAPDLSRFPPLALYLQPMRAYRSLIPSGGRHP